MVTSYKELKMIVLHSKLRLTFMHVTGLVDQISEGDAVEFELKEGKKGLNAVNVKQA